ncbi:MAG: cation transporter [Nitrospirae bacterium]|nr:cation transporter [Nitrospirota bacterium]
MGSSSYNVEILDREYNKIVAGSLVVWVGIRVSSNKYKRFTYGFYKIENLLAMAIGVAILYAAYELAMGFIHSKAVIPTNVTTSVVALLLLIAINFFWGQPDKSRVCDHLG